VSTGILEFFKKIFWMLGGLVQKVGSQAEPNVDQFSVAEAAGRG
jgi:hypothetical protein